jgi:hypothetical protein
MKDLVRCGINTSGGSTGLLSSAVGPGKTTSTTAARAVATLPRLSGLT